MAAFFRLSSALKRSPSRRKSPSWHRPRFRPRLEPLEGRILLSGAGSLNPRFGTGGLVTTNFGANDSATTVLTQPDGKIVVVGTDTALDGSFSQIAIARYNKHGSLDQSFGSGGKVLALFGSSDYVVGAVVRPSGKIIVDALEPPSPGSFPYENLLVQFNRDGTLDTSFGSGGSVVTPGFAASTGTYVVGKPIALGPHGEIVVVGSNTSSPYFPNMEVAEFNRDGSLNQNFGSGGTATFNFVHGFPGGSGGLGPSRDGTFQPAADAVAVDSRGRILVGGSVTDPGDDVLAGAALFRLNPDGTLDTTFGFNGSFTNAFGFNGGLINAVAIRPNGQIVVAGQAADPSTFGLQDFAVEQFNPDGTQDLRFGFDGVVGTTIPNVNLYVTGLAIQHSGDLVVVGSTTLNGASFTNGFVMARYTPDGNLDSTFGTNGLVTTFFPNAGAAGVALTAHDNIVVAGTVVDPETGHSDFGVAEYLGHPPAPPSPPPHGPPPPIPPPVYPSFALPYAPPPPRPGPFGKLDSHFGTGGVVTSGPNLQVYLASGIATQADGKIVAVGDSASTFGIVLVRYNRDGSLDQSFGTGGVVNTLVGNGDFYGSVIIQKDGKIVVAAQEQDPVTFQDNILLLRCNPDGSLDQSFGSGGIVTTALPNGQNFIMGGVFGPSPSNAVTLSEDGRIVVVGTASITTSGGPQNNGVVIAEYDKHGNLVPGFGSGGLVITTSFTDAAGNPITAPEANSVAVDRRGRILVAGSAVGPVSNPSFLGYEGAFLARFNPDGSLDQTFGFHGAVTNVFDVAGSNVFVPGGLSANAVAVRPDGQLVVAGSAIDPQSLSSSFAVEQFNPNGSPDLKFGSHGIALWGSAEGFFNTLNATSLVLQPGGDIVVAGTEQTDLIGINSLGIIRLRPNGTFDPSFGSNGVVTANPNTIGLMQFTPVLLAQEPGGNIVAEGTFSISVGGFVGEIGLAEFTARHSGPDLASGSALLPAVLSPSPTIIGPAAASSTPARLPATGSSLTDAFFAALSEAPPHAVWEPDPGADALGSSALDRLYASLRLPEVLVRLSGHSASRTTLNPASSQFPLTGDS